MADREKVVKGLEYCTGNHLCSGCGYYDPDNVRCQKDLMRDALELLKEQEPVTPKEVSMYPQNQYACGSCGHVSIGTKDYHAKFCPACGRKVKWE